MLNRRVTGHRTCAILVPDVANFAAMAAAIWSSVTQHRPNFLCVSIHYIAAHAINRSFIKRGI